MKKKLVLMTSALMAIGLLAGCGSQHAHEWGEVTYTWSDDYSSCTATRVCKDDESHKETETKDSVYAVTKEAKCEEDGNGRYTVTFDNEGLGVAHFDIALEAIGHEWGTPTYTWSDDYSSCTATRVCKNDSNHIESETADSAYTEIVPATCDTDGSAVYDAAFENEAFEVQSHEVTLPATDHEWGAITYTWADDNSTCTARRVCAHDATHVETETVNSTYEVVEEAKCEEDGKGRYTADFTSEAFVDQTKDITLEAIGHDLIHNSAVAATCYVPGNIEYWVCRECHQYFSDEACTHAISNEDVIVPAHHTLTHHEGKEATRLEEGNIEYWTCDVCGKYFSDEEGKNEIDAQSITIPALGTNKSYFKNATYSGSDRYLYFYLKQFDDYIANCIYSFNDFNYNDETKELSFIITKIQVIRGEAPYQVGDTISFTYDAEKDVLMFGTVKLSRSND